MSAEAEAREARSLDAFLGGLVTLVQPLNGHRAGLDAALLQALVPAGAAGLLIDLGAGVGTVGFCVAARAPALAAIGVERDPGLVHCGNEALARPENAAFASRVRLVAADASKPEAVRRHIATGDGPVSFVLMNPPFDREGRVRRSPDTRRGDAHVAAAGLLRSWSANAAELLAPGGIVGLIHRPPALPEILEALAGRFGDIRILPVHPSVGAAASRILVTARRGRRTPLAIAPGLVLHRAGGAWTPEADAILRGKAELDL